MGRGRPPPGRSKSPRPAPSRRGVPSKPRLAKPPVSTTACHAGPPTSTPDIDANREQHTQHSGAHVCGSHSQSAGMASRRLSESAGGSRPGAGSRRSTAAVDMRCRRRSPRPASQGAVSAAATALGAATRGRAAAVRRSSIGQRGPLEGAHPCRPGRRQLPRPVALPVAPRPGSGLVWRGVGVPSRGADCRSAPDHSRPGCRRKRQSRSDVDRRIPARSWDAPQPACARGALDWVARLALPKLLDRVRCVRNDSVVLLSPRAERPPPSDTATFPGPLCLTASAGHPTRSQARPLSGHTGSSTRGTLGPCRVPAARTRPEWCVQVLDSIA